MNGTPSYRLWLHRGSSSPGSLLLAASPSRPWASAAPVVYAAIQHSHQGSRELTAGSLLWGPAGDTAPPISAPQLSLDHGARAHTGPSVEGYPQLVFPTMSSGPHTCFWRFYSTQHKACTHTTYIPLQEGESGHTLLASLGSSSILSSLYFWAQSVGLSSLYPPCFILWASQLSLNNERLSLSTLGKKLIWVRWNVAARKVKPRDSHRQELFSSQS